MRRYQPIYYCCLICLVLLIVATGTTIIFRPCEALFQQTTFINRRDTKCDPSRQSQKPIAVFQQYNRQHGFGVSGQQCFHCINNNNNKNILHHTDRTRTTGIFGTAVTAPTTIRRTHKLRMAPPEHDIEIDNDDDEDYDEDEDEYDPGEELTDEELLASAGDWDDRIARYNTIHVTGRVGTKNEPKYLADGKVVITVSVATKRLYHSMERKLLSFANDDIQEDIDATDWYECEIWGQKAEFINKYVDKGAKVSVYGDLQLDTWNDKDTGEVRMKPKIRVREFEILESKAEADLRRNNNNNNSGSTTNYYNNNNKRNTNNYMSNDRGPSFFTSDNDDDDDDNNNNSNRRPRSRGFFEM